MGEGIETAEQVRHLQASGCDLGQGDLLARPSAPAELVERLALGPLDLGCLVH